ncbi:hypothetical protein PROFUN_02503 [Planoprotostelium fungivorum]|uniref:Uncharacterized protein n=1 Tax=Planoprotostelium fungivorum TaxID=1890364 RepID=A0A2P6MP53_9EUKA|nr:hypothetical protein PROFUN_02503 [Planoprotostelium fungivorum]
MQTSRSAEKSSTTHVDEGLDIVTFNHTEDCINYCEIYMTERDRTYKSQ